MLTGEYRHNMDAKGRITIPAKFREELGETFWVYRGLDGCLFVQSVEEWSKLMETLAQQPIADARRAQRFFSSAMEEVTPDKQGRILLSPKLRGLGGLEKDVTVIGMMNRAEIWDTARWEAYNANQSEEEIEKIMSNLGI